MSTFTVTELAFVTNRREIVHLKLQMTGRSEGRGQRYSDYLWSSKKLARVPGHSRSTVQNPSAAGTVVNVKRVVDARNRDNQDLRT